MNDLKFTEMEKIKNMYDFEFHVRVPAGASKEEVLKALTEEVERKMAFESEDERIRKEIIGYLESKVATAEETELLYFERWIAYLEEQKEQQPAEWSEEDELMLNWAIECCHKTFGEYPRKAELWLKSLRPQPHWKPSEEKCLAGVLDYDDLSQIELAVAVYWKKNRKCYPVTCEHQKKVLQKLYSLAGYDYDEFTHEWEYEE